MTATAPLVTLKDGRTGRLLLERDSVLLIRFVGGDETWIQLDDVCGYYKCQGSK